MIKLSPFLALVLILLFAKNVFAVELSLDYPKEINGREFEINFKTSGAKEGTNYLRIMVRKQGETNYLSETWNGSGWYSGGEGKNYLAIQVGSFETTGAVKGRLKDGVVSGQYEVALRRYSQSGSQAQTSEFGLLDFRIANVETPTPTTLEPSPSVSPTIVSPQAVLSSVEESSVTTTNSFIEEGESGVVAPKYEFRQIEADASTVSGQKEEGYVDSSIVLGTMEKEETPIVYYFGAIVFGLIGLILSLYSLYLIAVKVGYLV